MMSSNSRCSDATLNIPLCSLARSNLGTQLSQAFYRLALRTSLTMLINVLGFFRQYELVFPSHPFPPSPSASLSPSLLFFFILSLVVARVRHTCNRKVRRESAQCATLRSRGPISHPANLLPKLHVTFAKQSHIAPSVDTALRAPPQLAAARDTTLVW